MAQKRLTTLTGLEASRAGECLAQFNGCFTVALASVVQNRNKLPDSYFADKAALTTHAEAINDILEKLYQDAQRAIDDGAASDGSAAFKVVEAKATAAESAPKIDRYSGPFLSMPGFFEKEIVAKSTLFVMDRGFMARTPQEKLRERMLPWLDNCGLYRAPVKWSQIEDRDEEIVRVIIKDAVRTFFDDAHREKLVEFMYCVRVEFGNYGQAMSYLAAILCLALTEEEAIAILRKCNKEYIKGHWCDEAVGFATNAWAIEKIMQKTHPAVAKHFDSLNFWPDTYMQKVISGLCIHQLPFNLMFDFLDAFMQKGFMFLVKFVLSIVDHFQHELLKLSGNQVNELYEIMRLDPKIFDPTIPEAILAKAKAMPDPYPENDIPLLRSEVYDKKVGPRLAKAPKEPTFEPCVLCETERQYWFCEECGNICKKCHEAGAMGHNVNDKAHEVEVF